jgi:hypothetical protein
MASQENQDRSLWEMMEACRAGSDDLADPALAELAAELARDPRLDDAFSRLQQLDAMVAEAFQDVPVPAGLSARILERVRAKVGQVTVAPAISLRRRVRPWSWALGGAAAAAILAAVLLHGSRPGDYTPSEIWENAVALFNSELPGQGSLLTAESRPSSYPPSGAVQMMPQTHWRKISGFLGASGVAYDMTTAAGVRATLYVVKRSAPALGSTPPLRPAYSTANCSVAAWCESSLLYVLVVQGNSAAYESFLDVPGWPVT